MTNLTFNKTITQTVTSEVRIPKDWECYCGAGNSSLRKKAENFVAKIIRIKEQDLDYIETKSKIKKAFSAYIKSYYRFTNTNLGIDTGADDTAVRECVWHFATKVASAVDVDTYELDKIWDSAESTVS